MVYELYMTQISRVQKTKTRMMSEKRKGRLENENEGKLPSPQHKVRFSAKRSRIICKTRWDSLQKEVGFFATDIS